MDEASEMLARTVLGAQTRDQSARRSLTFAYEREAAPTRRPHDGETIDDRAAAARERHR